MDRNQHTFFELMGDLAAAVLGVIVLMFAAFALVITCWAFADHGGLIP